MLFCNILYSNFEHSSNYTLIRKDSPSIDTYENFIDKVIPISSWVTLHMTIKSVPKPTKLSIYHESAV
jgi:hypothetical protein